MDYFSTAQKRKVRDMIELEFYGKGQPLIEEGVPNMRAFMIIKGEVELQSTTNLYTLAL
jgi:signal-transduction protein with cAMP-binding, CBS, and nucleotidyltransferase domain